MKNIITLKELRLNMKKYATDVKSGKSFIVFKKNKPFFKIAPIENEERWEEIINFAKIKKDGVDIDELLSYL